MNLNTQTNFVNIYIHPTTLTLTFKLQNSVKEFKFDKSSATDTQQAKVLSLFSVYGIMLANGINVLYDDFVSVLKDYDVYDLFVEELVDNDC